MASGSVSSIRGLPSEVVRRLRRSVFGDDVPFPCPLKVSRMHTKAFYKEAITWKMLRHPNVVPFIGVTQNPLQFVSEWMPNGTLTKYISENPNVDRIGLVGLSSPTVT